MLEFDPARSAFLYDDVVIGPDALEKELAAQLDTDVSEFKGQPGWTLLEKRGAVLNLAVSFHQGFIHSGHFWASVPEGASWDGVEAVEAARRRLHSAITVRLFGAELYEDQRIRIDLVREPRSYLEQLRFVFLG